MEVKRRNLLERTFEPGFTVDLHHKDLGIVLGSASDNGVSLALTAVVQQMFNELRAHGRGGDDHSALLAVLEQHAGRHVAAGAERVEEHDAQEKEMDAMTLRGLS
jgi:2-hydroxy-3-oxopropionate reductase